MWIRCLFALRGASLVLWREAVGGINVPAAGTRRKKHVPSPPAVAEVGREHAAAANTPTLARDAHVLSGRKDYWFFALGGGVCCPT